MTAAVAPLDDFLSLLLRLHESAVEGHRGGGFRRSVGERRVIREYAAMADTGRAVAASTVGRLRRHLRRADERTGGPLRPDQLPAAARALVVHSLGVRDPLMDEAEAAFGEVEAARAGIPLRWWWRRAQGKVAADDPLLGVEGRLDRAEATLAAVWRRWAELES